MTCTEKRLHRERRTIQLMIGIYCRGRHRQEKALCGECQQLFDYAMVRVDKCPFQNNKPTCAKCPVHCYKPTMRAQVREAMRYAGPRMMWRHPLLALLHAWDGWKSSKKFV
ncbi:MAG: nitrous oxide-stimulated promoter family protein [Verrucomicrobia bacterium]|nr:nitrous oxide-stimulated promoter family protein [Verrucomicrobiota bacterium]